MTKPSRRAMLAALAAAPVAGVPALASVAHPDAELLRLGEEFERRYAASLRVNAECQRLVGLFDEEWDRRGLSIDANFFAWGQLRDEMGAEAAIEAQEGAFTISLL